MYQSLTATFSLGFKWLAWINCLGVLLVLLCALGLLQTDLTAYLLRLPLVAFVCGITFCGLGLMWSYLVQSSMIGQLVLGEPRRTHWIPLFCALVAYGLSLLAFVIGCWFLVNLAGLADQNSESTFSSEDEDGPAWNQRGQLFEYTDDATRDTIRFTNPAGPVF
ncbi:MAG TPA: hypothetical protein VIP51_16515 [Eoetvoesiella sp.]